MAGRGDVTRTVKLSDIMDCDGNEAKGYHIKWQPGGEIGVVWPGEYNGQYHNYQAQGEGVDPVAASSQHPRYRFPFQLEGNYSIKA